MKRVELNEMSDEELGELKNKFGIEQSMSREQLIDALATFPEQDDVLGYVDEVTEGSLVAFRTDNFKVKSAKVKRKSTSERKLLLETKYGRQFLVSFDDVVWINTSGKWPRWVYNLMKGIKEDESSKAEA